MNSEYCTIIYPREEEKPKQLRNRLRRSFQALGKSLDTHIYDVTDDFLKRNRGKEEARFIKKTRDFYNSLNHIDQMILLSEWLERGRIYPFWYYGMLNEANYRKEKKQVLSSFVEALS